MQDERYVIVTKGNIKKFPIDKRNRFTLKGDTTMDIFEGYLYISEDLALEDMADMNLSPKEYEVRKYKFTVEEVR
jgi:hypothetical protein